jgi:ABC-type bacteriocin/lantibiotic exporter with double-glycine peptidase domain
MSNRIEIRSVCAKIRYQNRHISEPELSAILGTQSFGTPISHINKLTAYQCQVTFRSFSLTELKEHLRQGMPVIVRVWTGMLTYWSEDSFHVVVALGYDNDRIYLNDPAFASAPQSVLWDGFLAAWAEYDEAAIVIQAL